MLETGSSFLKHILVGALVAVSAQLTTIGQEALLEENSGMEPREALVETEPMETAVSPQYRLIPGEKYGYELIWRERRINDWPDDTLVRLSQGEDRPTSGPWVYNWVARRDPCFLVSGDLPRFALMRTYRTPDINPSFMKMGELRIRVSVEGHDFWLDEAGPVVARFYPWGTIHELEIPGTGLKCRAKATLVGNRGVGVDFVIIPESEPVGPVIVEFHFGGMGAYQPHLLSSYIPVDDSDDKDVHVEMGDNEAISVSSLPLATPLYQTDETQRIVTRYQMTPWSSGSVQPSGESKRFVIQHRIDDLVTEERFQVLFFQSSDEFGEDLRIQDFKAHVKGAEDHYKELLDRYEIQTPEPLVDAGFYAAVMNLEYGYAPPAWY